MTHTFQDIHHEFKEHNSELDLLNHLCDSGVALCLSRSRELACLKDNVFLSLDGFPGGSVLCHVLLYIFSHTGIKRGSFSEERDRMILKLLLSFTLNVLLIWQHLLQAYRTEKV